MTVLVRQVINLLATKSCVFWLTIMISRLCFGNHRPHEGVMFLAAHAAQFKFLIFWVISPVSKFFKILGQFYKFCAFCNNIMEFVKYLTCPLNKHQKAWYFSMLTQSG